MTGRILGVHQNAMPAAAEATYPGAGWERLFVSDRGKPLPLATTSAKLAKLVFTPLARAWIDAGKGVVLSVKLDMDQVRRGLWDDRLPGLAEDLAGMRIILIISHEQENDTKAKVSLEGNDRAYDVIKAAAPDLTYATADLTYAWSLKKAKLDVRVTAGDAKLRGRRKRDLALADVYSGVTFPAQAILPEHDGWARWYELMAPDRWGIAERGFLSGPTRAATIAREAEWLATDPTGKTCEVYLYWATGGQEANAGWLLDDAGGQAVAAMLKRLFLPAGYEEGPVSGFLVHGATGALISATRTSEWDSFVSQKG